MACEQPVELPCTQLVPVSTRSINGFINRTYVTVPGEYPTTLWCIAQPSTFRNGLVTAALMLSTMSLTLLQSGSMRVLEPCR